MSISLKHSYIISILAFSAYLHTAAAAPETPELADETRKDTVSYHGSTELPDGIAFRVFLALIQSPPEDPEPVNLRLVAKALGIDADETGGYEAARPYAEMFQDIRRSAERDKTSEKFELLCTPNRASRTDVEALNALVLAEDLDDEVNDRYYAETLTQLGTERRSHFQDFLETVKKGTSYSRSNDAAPGMTGLVEVERYCAELGYKLEGMEERN